MNAELQKDQLKEMDWKALGGTESSEPYVGPVVKKRLPKKIRLVPRVLFSSPQILTYDIAFYGSCIAAGVGAGMLLEVWINKKVKEDGGVIWEFYK